MEGFRIDHDLHIHSHLSLCSDDPGQTSEAILAWGQANHLHTLALTNHFWDDDVSIPPEWYHKQNYAHIAQALPLPQASDCRFLFGIEGEMDHDLTIGIRPGTYDRFAFIIIPTTHLHMDGFTIYPETEGGIAERAGLWIRRFEALLASDLPAGKTGIAHLTCPLIAGSRRNTSFEEHLRIIDVISDDEYARLFAGAAARGYGIELNMPIFNYSEEDLPRVLRPYRIAKDCGCKFYLGSDAHSRRAHENAAKGFARMVSLLGLTEEDKLELVRR